MVISSFRLGCFYQNAVQNKLKTQKIEIVTEYVHGQRWRVRLSLPENQRQPISTGENPHGFMSPNTAELMVSNLKLRKQSL